MNAYCPVTTIAVANAENGATVTAAHIPTQRMFCVACSFCGPLSIDTYSARTRSVEVRICHRNANVRATIHASGCDATRVYTPAPLTDATSGGRP